MPTLSVRGRRAETPGIVCETCQKEFKSDDRQIRTVSDVGNDATESLGGPGILVNLCIHVGGRAKVGLPAKPAGMPTIEIHGYVWKVELSNGVVGALKVRSLGTRALGNIQVGDKVGQGVGLWIVCQTQHNIATR